MQSSSSSSDAAPVVPLDPMDVDPVDDGPRQAVGGVVITPPVGAAGGGFLSSSSSLPGVLQLASPEAMVVTTEQDAKQCLDWLRSEDLSLRVPAAHRLDAVAQWLGPERTRSVRCLVAWCLGV